MSAPLVLGLVLAVVIPVQLLRAYRADDALVERWAGERGLALTPESRPLVADYVRRARILRTWGGACGAVLPSVLEYLVTGRVQVLGFGTDGESEPLGFGSIFVGYLAGALLAEVALRRPRGGRRAAALTPRELEHYLPRTLLAAQRGLTVAAAAGIVVLGLVPYPPETTSPQIVPLAIAAAVVLALGGGLEALERWLVRRPQPFRSPALAAAEDAIREQSIQSVAGAGLALLLLLCCGVALGLQASDVPALDVPAAVAAAVFLVLSLLACRDIGQAPWRVRRTVRAPGAASA